MIVRMVLKHIDQRLIFYGLPTVMKAEQVAMRSSRVRHLDVGQSGTKGRAVAGSLIFDELAMNDDEMHEKK
jgi:hypothetical protein